MITEYPFNVPANYDYDSDLIEVTGGKASLKLQEGDIDFTQSCENDIGFTYDNTKSEFLSGMVRQKLQDIGTSILGAKFIIKKEINWAISSYTEIDIGTPSIGSYGLFSNNGVNGRQIDCSALGSMVNKVTIEFDYTPNFTGAPATGLGIISLSDPAGTAKSKITIYHLTSGNIGIIFYNSIGSIVYSGSFTYSSVAGVTNNFSVVLDYADGNRHVYFFQDGILKISLNTSTITRDSSATRLKVLSGIDYPNANGSVKNLRITPDVLYTANYTPSYIIPSAFYEENNIIFPEMEHIGDGSIKLFNSFSGVYSGLPRVILEIGRSGNKLYWNGFDWVISDETYAQANSFEDFNTKCNLLPVDGEKYGQFTIIFPDSSSLSSVSSITANMHVNIGYSMLNPKIKPKITFRTTELLSFLATIEKSGNDNCKFTLEINDIEKYWNGSQWVNSTSYLETNTYTEINDNISTLLTSMANVKWIMHIHSEIGLTTPNSDIIKIGYNFEGEAPDELNICEVWWNMAQGSKAYIYLKNDAIKYKNNVLLRKETYTFEVIADEYNYCEVSLPDTKNMELDELGNEQTYIVIIDGKKYEIKIPESEQALLFDLIGA